MDLRIHADIHIHPPAEPDPRTAKILTAVLGIASKVKSMATELETLTQEVTEARTVMESARAMIVGLAEQLRAAGTDKAALAALASQLDGGANALAEAVAANTVAAQEPTPAPEPAPEPAPAEPVTGSDGAPVTSEGEPVTTQPGAEPQA